MLDTRGMTAGEANNYCDEVWFYSHTPNAERPCSEHDPVGWDCQSAECIMCCAAHEQGRGTTPTLHDVMLSALYAARDELAVWHETDTTDEGTARALAEVNAAIEAAESEENR